ncbi:DUF4357 domain-containing protein [Motilimonas cestriensis]|uniref:DUF4357 domain-containing protein n=1 Tax=Motilimonas cestriensis TaxID=2742685 RepID=A0ABS8W4M3_9GAMM|nr:DUF4357 domain-containing protein [Motilimonas cestriensis]
MSNSVQFLVDANGVRQAVVIPIDLYNELITLKQEIKTLKPAQQESYHFQSKEALANGYPKGPVTKPSFVVLRGSTANFSNVGSLRPAIKKLRDELLAQGTVVQQGELLLFDKEVEFTSPSMAACFIAGNARSGLDAWVNSQGKTLKQSGYGKK